MLLWAAHFEPDRMHARLNAELYDLRDYPLL